MVRQATLAAIAPTLLPRALALPLVVVVASLLVVDLRTAGQGRDLTTIKTTSNAAVTAMGGQLWFTPGALSDVRFTPERYQMSGAR